jgi:hypothetical protein
VSLPATARHQPQRYLGAIKTEIGVTSIGAGSALAFCRYIYMPAITRTITTRITKAFTVASADMLPAPDFLARADDLLAGFLEAFLTAALRFLAMSFAPKRCLAAYCKRIARIEFHNTKSETKLVSLLRLNALTGV